MTTEVMPEIIVSSEAQIDRCATCRHWQTNYRWGRCEKLIHIIDVFVKEIILTSDDGAFLNLHAKIDHIDTPNDFGCAAWEAK